MHLQSTAPHADPALPWGSRRRPCHPSSCHPSGPSCPSENQLAPPRPGISRKAPSSRSTVSRVTSWCLTAWTSNPKP